jgi:DNA repair protein RecO (recombination protein O)
VIVKTDAVVLQARRFRESSKIVTLYTRQHGKMSVIARGVVGPKSKYGAALQPMAFLSTVIYRKEGRDLQNLSVAEQLERFSVINGSLERMTAGLAIVELVNAVMHDEDRNDPLFETLVATLRALNHPDTDESSIQLWFLIRLAVLLGYAVRTEECGICDEPLVGSRESIPYSLTIGAPLCAEHQESIAYRAMSAPAFALLRELCSAEIEEAAIFRPASQPASELNDLLTAFIRYHVEGPRRLKVRTVSAKVLDDPAPQGAPRG